MENGDGSLPEKAVKLSERQQQCLRLVASGMTSKEIAHRIGTTPGTVDNHIQAAIKITGAATRREAARVFLEDDQEGVQRVHMHSGNLVSPPVSAILDVSEGKGSEHQIRRQALPIRVAKWAKHHVGGSRHDLSRTQVLLAIVLAALVSAGLLALIIATFFWLNILFS
jgi:DNA-binding CsgD family transcriptional regulator